MTEVTYIQGNSFSLSVPLLKREVAKENDTTTITTEPFIPASGDVVTVKLIGERRQYTYTPTMSDNVAVVELSGNELCGRYAIEVTIIAENGERMRYAQPMALALVPYTGTVDSIVVGSATLDASIFLAMRGAKGDKGDDGNGIANIAKTSTSGLVDTYTITYTNGSTSTFEVTNGRDGAQGAQGVGVQSITQTSTSTESSGVNVITCVLTDGTTSTFEVRNGASGAQGAQGEKGEKGDSGQVPQVTVTGATPTQELAPNTFYVFGSVTSLTVTLGSAVSGIANIYAFRFTAGQDNPTITLPSGVVCNQDLSLKTGDVCEFSIMDNQALFSVWEA